MNRIDAWLQRKRPDWIPGNRVEILKNGAEIFPEMLQAIARAKETVHLEMYIFRNDEIGRLFADALSKKAYEGISVKLIYDSLGSLTTSSEPFFSMKQAGVEMFEYHPIVSWYPLGRRLRKRDHRKMLIVDGRYGFVGGINIGNEYADRSDGGEGWRDTNIRLEGPAVRNLQQIFLSTWTKKGTFRPHPSHYPDLPPAGDFSVSIVASQGMKGTNQIKRAYLDAIRSAQERICITNSYFVPPPRILRAIRKASQRGVEIYLLVPQKSDVRLIDYACRALYAKLLGWGVRIFEWEGSVLHSKTAVIDRKWSTVGTCNMDQLSLFYNLEVNVVIKGKTFGDQMEAMFWEDLKQSREILATDWIRRRGPFRKILENTSYYLLAWL